MSSKVLSQSSKHLLFFSLRRLLKRYEGTIFHTAALCVLPVVHQQAYKSTMRLGIIQNNPNRLKKTFQMMEEKMVHIFPILFAHTTPINHNDMPLSEIVHGKDIS